MSFSLSQETIENGSILTMHPTENGGTPPALILVPGLNHTAEQSFNLYGTVDNNETVLSTLLQNYDVGEFNPFSSDREEPTLSELATMLYAELDKLLDSDLDSYIFVNHSLGGNIVDKLLLGASSHVQQSCLGVIDVAAMISLHESLNALFMLKKLGFGIFEILKDPNIAYANPEVTALVLLNQNYSDLNAIHKSYIAKVSAANNSNTIALGVFTHQIRRLLYVARAAFGQTHSALKIPRHTIKSPADKIAAPSNFSSYPCDSIVEGIPHSPFQTNPKAMLKLIETFTDQIMQEARSSIQNQEM